MTETQISVPCLRCGKPSAAHGEHHQRVGPGPTGRGMGGGHEHLVNVPLCRGCHEAVHAKRFTISLSGNMASTWENGHCVSERALVVNESHKDPRYWSDERLADAWGKVDELMLPLMAIRCAVAYEFERRYKWLGNWDAAAAQVIGRLTGTLVHERTVRDAADVWKTFGDRWQDYKYVGARVGISIARAADPEAALAFGTSQVDEGGRSRTEIATDIHDKFGKQDSRGETHECPDCGAKHRIKKGE